VAVTLNTCIPNVMASNLGRVTNYTDWGSSWFLSIPPGKCLRCTSITRRSFPSKLFLIHYSSVIWPFDAIGLQSRYWQYHRMSPSQMLYQITVGTQKTEIAVLHIQSPSSALPCRQAVLNRSSDQDVWQEWRSRTVTSAEAMSVWS
jgi:hypothetical protein